MVQRCELGFEIEPLLRVEPLVSCEWLNPSDKRIFLSRKGLQVRNRLIRVRISVAFAVRHVRQVATGKRRLPLAAGVEALHRRKLERDWKRGPALLVPALDRVGDPRDTGAIQFTLQAGNSLPDATGDHDPQGSVPLIIPDLSMEVFAKGGSFIAPMQGLDSLLGAQGDQHTEHDHANLPRESAPAVQRFGDRDVHLCATPEITGA